MEGVQLDRGCPESPPAEAEGIPNPPGLESGTTNLHRRVALAFQQKPGLGRPPRGLQMLMVNYSSRLPRKARTTLLL